MSRKSDIISPTIIEPEWLASRWHVLDNQVISDSGELIGVFQSYNVAEYLVAMHHRYLHLDYAAGQLEFDFTIQ